MKEEPVRLRDDPRQSRSLREDLVAASSMMPPTFDAAAGLARLEGTLRNASAVGGLGGATTLASGGSLPWIAGALALAAVAASVLPSRRSGPSHVAPPAHTARTEHVEELEPPPLLAPAAPEAPDTAAASSPTSTIGARRERRAAPTPEVVAVDPLRREIELVSRARSALSTDPAAALQAVETADHEIATGRLAEEREALAVLSLDALGRHDEARRRAEAYLARWPLGAQHARIRAISRGGDR